VIVWRISEHPVLDGAGGLALSARWHNQGRPVVYCAPNPATALVEVLVHIEVESDDLPERLQYLEIEAPNTVATEIAEIDARATDWHTKIEATQAVGDEWLGSGRTALLRVPSVIVPATWNILINPLHPSAAQVRIKQIHHHPTDMRLLR
jgi:RES domain-containing protein